MNDLRDYQQDAVSELRQAVGKSGSAVYVCPTGAGKTVVASEIARLAAKKGSKTLFLVHQKGTSFSSLYNARNITRNARTYRHYCGGTNEHGLAPSPCWYGSDHRTPQTNAAL